MNKEEILAEIEKVKKNSVLPEKFKKIKLDKLDKQLKDLTPSSGDDDDYESQYDSAPQVIKDMIDNAYEKNGGFSYESLGKLNTALKKKGWEIDYGLDAEITSLKKINGGKSDKEAKKPKQQKPVKATYKGKNVKELNEENCKELLAENEARMKSSKASAKKSKSKPVIEKIASTVVRAAAKAIKNVPVEDIKDDPGHELGLMDKVIGATKKYLGELKTILGEDWDSAAITDEMKPLVDLVKDLRKKYDE